MAGIQLNDRNGNPVTVETVVLGDGNTAFAQSLIDENSNHILAAPGGEGALLASSDGTKATYRYSASAQTPAATPTDLVIIQGSATKTVRVKRIRLGGIATTAGSMPVQLLRRSAANTGGTSAAVVAGKHDTTDANATAVVSLYSVNAGSLGATAGGPIASARLWLPLSTGQPFPVVLDFCDLEDKAFILRGVADFLAINFGGATVPAGGVVDFTIECEEDSS